LPIPPSDQNGRAVLFADGSVQLLNAEKFQEALQRDAAVPRAVFSPNAPPAPAQPPAPVAATAAPIDPATGLPAAITATAGGVMGGGGGAGGTAAPLAKATATGVRPIRIDVPRTGQAFSFTKVLNAGQEPLTVSVAMMRLKVYRALLMVVQVCAFVFGLLLMWWLASRAGAKQPLDDHRRHAHPLVGRQPAHDVAAVACWLHRGPCR